MQRTISFVWLLALGLFFTPTLGAQRFGEAERAPRFLLAMHGSSPVHIDARALPTLRHRLSLHFEEETLEGALRAVTTQTGLRFTFSRDVVPVDRRVTLKAEQITLAAALTELLIGTGIDVVFSPSGQAALVRQPPPPPTPAESVTGTLTGTVTDAETDAPVATAEVRIDGTRFRTVTSNQGRYILTAVPPGTYSVSVRRIGYEPQNQAVTVMPDASVTLDFALAGAPTYLDGVVATVTGEQRIREVGHVVGKIKADSVVRASPVASMSDLLTGRVPGLQVFQTQGTVGGDASLRIRGVTTFLLDQEPIVIVDGVRFFSGRIPADGGPGQFNLGNEPTFRLNDLNPNEIESIEVVKGPSAATLYGTDAVNGVIVITTKRGQPGPARWSAYSRYSVSEVPTGRFPDLYRGVSSTVDNCTLPMVAQAQCVQERIERIPNPMTQSDYTLFGSAPVWMYGLSVSGGSAGIRYTVSGDYEDAVGPVQMPPAIAERARQARGVDRLPDNQLRPNQATKLNVRTNLSLALSESVDLQGNVGIARNTTNALNFVYGPYQSSLVSNTSTPEDPFGSGPNQPEEAFSRTSTELVNRMTGGLRAEARLRSWWSGWAAIGVDLANSDRANLAMPGEGSPTGLVSDIRRKNMLTTADIGSRFSSQVSAAILSRTAIGAQYVRSFTDGLAANGTNLPPGGKTVASAGTQTLSVNHTETVTLGGYIEQTIGYRDRLFVSGALRADGVSTFGRDYNAVIYPKFNASWILSDEAFMAAVPGLQDLRVRYAYGGSGRQPTTAMALPTFLRVNRVVYGANQGTMYQSALGNPDLRPERTFEHEYGFDAGVLQDRIRLEATWYNRTTIDGIRSMTLQTGYGSRHVNVGEVKDWGVETQLGVRVLDHSTASWDVTFQHSRNNNRVVSLGDAPAIRSGLGGAVEGYPLGARFLRPYLGYEDLNGDGIIEQHEVLLGDTVVYLGVASPPVSQTLHSTVGLFSQRIRLSALLDRRAGHTLQDNRFYGECSAGYCRALVDPDAPKDLQALAVAPRLNFGRVSRADHVRLREIGVVTAIPTFVLGRLGVSDASLSLQARNLALWTSYTSVDPESNSASTSASTNGSRGSLAGIPLPRIWVMRIDLGF